jgi:hypothetical protein
MPVADLLAMADAAADKGHLRAARQFLNGAFELAREHKDDAELADCEYYARYLFTAFDTKITPASIAQRLD